VFSHLLAFFSRYYQDGDFISQRRYKGDTYAIPYAGEEVMLHWANKDQYYTKSGENFANYSFKLEDGRTVHFRLVAADTAKDNRKDNDKERRFALVERPRPLPASMSRATNRRGTAAGGGSGSAVRTATRTDHPLRVRRPAQRHQAGGAGHKGCANRAGRCRRQGPLAGLGQRAPTEKNPQRTLLEKHLSDYTTKNTADYFIHKDLGWLSCAASWTSTSRTKSCTWTMCRTPGAFADIEKSLRMIQCLRASRWN
jgi:adenine-specific DNA-methyltransferase